MTLSPARLASSALLSVLSLAPLAAGAHEVYVLTPDEIRTGLMTPAFSAFAVIAANMGEFAFWAFLGALLVFIVFFASISRLLERLLDPFFMRAKHYGRAVARVTIGISFLAAAYFQALFGPELPFTSVFPGYEAVATIILLVVGALILVGAFTRLAALAALALFGIAAFRYGAYMLTYANYFGEILVLLLIGPHRFGIDRFAPAASRARHALDALAKKAAPYSFLILRVCFGTALLYASLYAKFLHNDLALQVASLPLAGHAYSVAHYLGFEPHFLVLGAGIVEIVIALFFILGIEIRFTALFLEFWLTLSLLYFGEVVWPHIVLIGIPIAFFLYGYDKYSLEGFFFKKPGREPVF